MTLRERLAAEDAWLEGGGLAHHFAGPQRIRVGHHEVKLSEEEMPRITLWLDANSVFYGAYHDADKQLAGKVVEPTLE